MNRLKLVKLRFTMRFNADTQLPPFIGNTIRGAFGYALSRHCCKWEAQRCEVCENKAICAYSSMFKRQNSESMPNPYIISAPFPSSGSYKEGSTLDFFITLCGCACVYQAAVISAAESMCTGKLQNAAIVDARPEYTREWSDDGAGSIAPCDAIFVRFLSPAEIRSGGAPVKSIDFSLFIERLFARISGIVDNYADRELVLPYHLLGRIPLVRTECSLKQSSFFTNRQRVDAVFGTISFFGDVTKYLPYIDLGTQLHIGKKTTRGCGEYAFDFSPI